MTEPDRLLPLGSALANTWKASRAHVDLVRPARAAKVATLAAEPQSLTLDLSSTAMLVIDMQNDFCHPEGWLSSIGVDVSPAREPIDPLCRLLPRLRSVGVPVLWVNWGNRPDRLNLSPSLLHVYNPDARSRGLGAELPPRGSRVLEKDSWGAAIVDELAPAPEDIRHGRVRHPLARVRASNSAKALDGPPADKSLGRAVRGLPRGGHVAPSRRRHR